MNLQFQKGESLPSSSRKQSATTTRSIDNHRN